MTTPQSLKVNLHVAGRDCRASLSLTWGEAKELCRRLAEAVDHAAQTAEERSAGDAVSCEADVSAF